MYSSQRGKNLPELNIISDNNGIKQFHIVEYLGCYLEASLSGKFMAMKSFKKIISNSFYIHFFFINNPFLTLPRKLFKLF